MQDWLNILVRSSALFFGVLVIVRIMGKRHPSRMTPFYHVVYTYIAITAALIATNIIANVVIGLIALVSWQCWCYLLTMRAKEQDGSRPGNGRETVLIKQGKIMEENLGQAVYREGFKGAKGKERFNPDVEFALLKPR